VLGVDHPYAVISKDTPSLLPEGAIAVRFHSIGGWGMITTGKNLGSIIGDFGASSRSASRAYDIEGVLETPQRHGQPEVRLGEEGRAHELLPHRGAGTQSG
jgi:hypothetical protein